MIGLCTDSNAQLPDELRERYRVEVVPLTVTVDGQEFLEGVDLDADGFYARFPADGDQTTVPVVTTAAPAPGRFLAAWEALADAGATEILSIHLGSQVSGTVNAASLAARTANVPVHVVDTGTASFAISCCVWQAAEAIAGGAGLAEAAAAATEVARRCDNVFVVGALHLARSGGRLAPGTEEIVGDAIGVLSLVEGSVKPVAQARTLDEAAQVMADYVRATGSNLRVGIGVADAGAAELWGALERRLSGVPEVLEVVRYRIGPSVGAHTGPGTAGACSYPAPR